MNEQALNKKLAEWAGWEKGEWVDPVTRITMETEIPDFNNSLDACFKWLVPKVDSVNLHIIIKEDKIHYQYKETIATVYHGNSQWDWTCTHHETPALALCLAIEKLIDGSKP